MDDVSYPPPAPSQEVAKSKRHPCRKHPIAVGCLSVVLFITLLCIVVWILAVPANYYRWMPVCLGYLRNYLMVVLVATIIFRIIISSRLIGWTLLLIGFVPWAIWLMSHGQQSGKVSKSFDCEDKMRHIYRVIQEYCDGNGGWYPPSLEHLIELKLLTTEDVHCPGCRWHNPGDIDYWYYGAGIQRRQQDDKDVLLRDKAKNHFCSSRDCITFEGFRVRSVTSPPAEWESKEDTRYFKDGKIVKTW